MNPGNHHHVIKMRAAGMRLDALCRHYRIDRSELHKILGMGPPRQKRHPAMELIEEGHSLADIAKLFDVTELRQVCAQSAANLPPLSVAAE
jgi:hypothetical protein